MGDPFSVAGTAVGITSLGIQTFQILYQYYVQLKGYHDDIDHVLRRIEGLQGILDSLQQMKESFERDNHAPSSQLHMALTACQDALARLKSMADKCNVANREQSLEARIRDARKRLIWPFKKETLGDMQRNLMHEKTIDIGHSLVRQEDVLDVLHRDLNAASIVQQHQNADLARELFALRAAMSYHTTALASQLMLIRSGSSIRNPAMVPSHLVQATQAVEHIQPQFEQTLQKYTYLGQQATLDGVVKNTSTCHCRRKRRRSRKRWTWISTISEENYTHQPSCPRFFHADYSSSVAAQFTMYTRMIGLCVQVGWQCSRIKGWNTVAPVLRCRAVVSSDHSPVFKLLRDAESRVERCETGDKEELIDIISNTMAVLPKLFGETAHPTDIDESGYSILHTVVNLLHLLILRGFDDSEVLLAILDQCLIQGVPIDVENSWGMIPILSWQYSMIYLVGDTATEAACSKILLHLVRKSSYWTVNVHAHDWYKPRYFAYISSILEIGEAEDSLDEVDPFLQVILRRSVQDFCCILNKNGIENLEKSLQTRETLRVLSTWLAGLKVIVPCISQNGMNGVMASLWYEVIRSADAECIWLLLQYQKQIHENDWHGALHGYSAQIQYDLCKQTLDGNLWAKNFHLMAERLFTNDSYDTDNDINRSMSETSGCNQYKPLVYHALLLSVVAAESAWTVGFRNMNLQTECGPGWGWDLSGTSLWINSEGYWNNWDLQWPVINWLLDHGADPAWRHPTLLSTPTHNIVRRAMEYSIRIYTYDLKISTNEMSAMSNKRIQVVLGQIDGLLTSDLLDGCTCYCSLGGCRAIGCAVSKHTSGDASIGKEVKKKVSIKRKNKVSHLMSFPDRGNNITWVASAIIRVMTFEKLALTHTCCYRIFDEMYGSFVRPTPEEAQIIYDLERDDISLLESLVAEFDASWVMYNKPFATFMKRVWKPRMQEVFRKREVNKEVYEAELVRMGVTLGEPNVERDYDSDSETDFYFDEDSSSDDEEEYLSADEGKDEETRGVKIEEVEEDESISH